MIDWLELNTEVHAMSAEGTSDTEPSQADVQAAIVDRGYQSCNVSICYDEMQTTWRFIASLINS